MTYFSVALNSALLTTNSTQTSLAKAADLDVSLISKYCRGVLLPDVDLLNDILRQFELPDRLKLITAYLQDHIPLEIADRVSVKTTDSQHVEIHIPRSLSADVSVSIANGFVSDGFLD